jgi:hypothetical protein
LLEGVSLGGNFSWYFEFLSVCFEPFWWRTRGRPVPVRGTSQSPNARRTSLAFNSWSYSCWRDISVNPCMAEGGTFCKY